jgi:YbbR domain-containing protein
MVLQPHQSFKAVQSARERGLMNLLRQLVKFFPTLLLSMTLAIAVWIVAVTSTDPVQERAFPRQINIEMIGQSPSMIVTSQESEQLSLRLSAPSSIWDRLNNDSIPVRAVVDLSGLKAGTHTLPVQIQIGIQPVRIVSQSPLTLTLTQEELATASFPIHILQHGDIAIGYETGMPSADQETATISGPKSLVNRVKDLRILLDINNANGSIKRLLTVQAYDENDLQINGLTISPEQITVSLPVTQRGGYRNVVVKVVTIGQVSDGYRLTTISVSPPAVTVFASNPTLVDKLPGYVETSPVDLTGAKDNLDVRVTLNLPEGISVVGDKTVSVTVGVSAIEGSISLNDIPVQVINLNPEFGAELSPKNVNIILSGPLPLLDRIKPGDIRVIIDLQNVTTGKYQLVPRVELTISDLRVESVLPGSIEVVVGPPGTATPVPLTQLPATRTPPPIQ